MAAWWEVSPNSGSMAGGAPGMQTFSRAPQRTGYRKYAMHQAL
jgi:hypothetical protein